MSITTPTDIKYELNPAIPPFLPVILAIIAFLSLCWLAFPFGGWRYVIASFIGLFAGFALYHASFGFTAGWRRIVTERRGNGLRAQMLLILIVCALSYPLIAYGKTWNLGEWNMRSGAFVFPFGVGSAVGAFIFGVGMQLGGSCASGTLFTAGGGSTRMMITLASFVAGSVFGTAHLNFWNELPRFDAFSTINNYGPAIAFLLTAVFVMVVVVWSIKREREAHGDLEPLRKTGNLITGPWSLVLGALALVVVSIGTILTLGRPWGITSGFVLWGAKAASALGVDMSVANFWHSKINVSQSVFSNSTSIMNMSIILGALLAAGLASKFKPVLAIGWKGLATAIIGGLMMGYGARLASGCNIGAYLAGIVSGSLHGWFWGIFAFIGSTLMSFGKIKWKL
ncbi:MAG: YeeE/YedE family protein [Rhizobiaceae bacterium]